MSSSQRRGPSLPLRAEGPLPVDGSWRMVEGEHDSFDTTILPSTGDEADDGPVPLPSRQPSSAFPSQLSSQGNMSPGSSGFGSQDSIRDFVKYQDDDQVILREPFRPSVISTASSEQQRGYRTPDPQFKMPSMHMDDSRRSSGNSSRTIKPFDMGTSHEGEDEGYSGRRRDGPSNGGPVERRSRRRTSSSDHGSPDQRIADGGHGSNTLGALGSNIAALLPSAVLRILVWAGEIAIVALGLAKCPLGLLLAACLVFGGVIIVQNMAT
ncbi:hypothetical protein C2857_003416 [Epichloe festucae Fl1]|uniref:Uncharacterized protein n=1 Tax=Epichloe festucae (strain Fl1) TaxID=877507 RepID=A0A7U3Q286_EPIFF|nr:hypothetical protein C2857_003416 [Epichloe festucae Fl1]